VILSKYDFTMGQAYGAVEAGQELRGKKLDWPTWSGEASQVLHCAVLFLSPRGRTTPRTAQGSWRSGRPVPS